MIGARFLPPEVTTMRCLTLQRASAALAAVFLLALILSGLLFAVWLEAFARHVRGGTMISDHR